MSPALTFFLWFLFSYLHSTSESKGLKILQKIKSKSGKRMEFEQAWQQIQEIVSSTPVVHTLSRRVPNRIIYSDENVIIVESERPAKSETPQERKLKKEKFRQFWKVLTQQGQMVQEDVREYHGVGRIIMAFLARLPYVEYSLQPQTLYLMLTATHEIGTIRERRTS